MTTDSRLVHDGVTIAYRDHGGDGPPVVLIPGAGRTLEDFVSMVPILTERHRVVAMDLRGHGLSSDGPWSTDSVVADVAAVVEATGLERPAIAGHSLGGMIAALYGAAVDDCTAAVNIDGHGQGRAEQFVGFTVEEATQHMAELRELAVKLVPPAKDFTPEEVAAVRAAALARLEVIGVSPDVAGAGFDRGIAAQPDGTFRVRPSKDQQEQLLALVERLDLFELYRSVRCPLLIFNATRADQALAGAGVPEWLPAHLRAFRAGLSRDLAGLHAERPHVSVSEIDATHALILEQPETVARQVSDFVVAAAAQPVA